MALKAAGKSALESFRINTDSFKGRFGRAAKWSKIETPRFILAWTWFNSQSRRMEEVAYTDKDDIFDLESHM
jgi:hypothetical protein